MYLPFENALQRERERLRRHREGGQHTDLSAGVGSPSAPPPLDISNLTDMVTELTRPVDRAQLDQDIEDFNISYPVNVDDALNLFSLPPVAGVGTAPGPPLPHHPSPRPPCEHDPARPPEHVPSLPPPPYPHRPPADHDPSLPPGHVPLPPHPPVDVQEQGHRPPRRPWRHQVHVPESLPNNHDDVLSPVSSTVGWQWRWWRWSTEGITAKVRFAEWRCSTTCSRQAHSKYHAYQYSDHGLPRRRRATLCAPHLDLNLQSKSTLHTTTPRTWPWPWPSARTWSTLVKKDLKTASSIKKSQ